MRELLEFGFEQDGDKYTVLVTPNFRMCVSKHEDGYEYGLMNVVGSTIWIDDKRTINQIINIFLALNDDKANMEV